MYCAADQSRLHGQCLLSTFRRHPTEWTGKRIWLKIGGVRSEARIVVNGQRVAFLKAYCGTYKYDITDHVTPGQKAEIFAAVRNDTPSRKGCMALYHRFGGFYRDIELEATPATWIDDVWVRGDLDKKTAILHANIQKSATDKPLQNLSVEVDVKTKDGKLAATFRKPITLDVRGQADLKCEMPLDPFLPWSPESPNLYIADVRLCSAGKPVHGWSERFGVRKFEARGKQFYLNNKPFLIRGFGDDYIYPLTLTSPTDHDEHRKHLTIARKAGFNYVRHHTHCEIPEFFEAADELGILIQPELPYYHHVTPEGFHFDPLRDLKELYRHYRRYASFGSYSCGNEGLLGRPLDEELYQWAKTHDPDRLFQHQDGGYNTPKNSDYYTPHEYGLKGTSIVPWEPGKFDYLEMPFIAHEYLNLGIKLDPRLDPKFTGVTPAPRTLKKYEASLQAAGLDRRWGDACLNAAHALQAYYQKEGLEQARLDPACDGYIFWTIIDVMVHCAGTYTGQGYLNAFWEVKEGGLTPEEFSHFNSPTVILAKNIVPPIAVSGETRKIDLWFSHFGAEPLKQAKLTWALKSETKVLATGSTASFDAAIGDVKTIAPCTFTVPVLEKPVYAQLEVKLDGTDITNHWDFWLFPKRMKKTLTCVAVTDDLFEVLSKRYNGIVKAGTPEAKNATMVIGSWDHPALLEANKAGKRALMLGPAGGDPNVKLGWWAMGNQVGTAFAKHPAFGDFPTTTSISPLWFRLIKQGMPLPIDPKFGRFEHLSVGEGKTQYFTYLTQKKNDKGADILMTHGIDLLATTPEGEYLMDQMIDYVQSDKFK